MKTYEIYFELFGKKMKTTITANSEYEAKDEIFNKIEFHKISCIDETDDEIKTEHENATLDELMSILGIKK